MDKRINKKETNFTTPDTWENEGLNLVGLDR